MNATITYRKTRNGEWVAYGPAELIKAGEDVEITTKAGKKSKKWIHSLGKTFEVDGVEMVYGYFEISSKIGADKEDVEAMMSGYGSPLRNYKYA